LPKSRTSMHLKHIFPLIALFVITSCTSDLKKEQKQYDEALKSFNVTLYKGSKTLMRASATITVDSTSLSKVLNVANDSIGKATELVHWINKFNQSKTKNPSGNEAASINYLKLASSVWGLRNTMQNCNEDQYPLFIERISGKEKIGEMNSLMSQYGLSYSNSTEHFVFALIEVFSFAMPTDIVLYELSLVKEEELGNNELLFLKEILQCYVMSSMELNHLAEDHCSKVIDHIENRPYSANILTKADVAGQARFQNAEAVQNMMHTLAYSMRSYIRYKIGKEDDIKQAQEDIVIAIDKANQSGINVAELNLLAATLSLKSGDKTKAREFCLKAQQASGDPQVKEMINQMIQQIDNGNEDEAQSSLNNSISQYGIVFKLVKDYSWYALDKEGFMENKASNISDNPIRAYFDFVEFYMLEKGQFDQYAKLEFYKEKTKNIFN
jgi:hypothetical protein